MSQTRERAEFASYLRSRRARLRPADVGLPDGTRRRVLGLRREEVAQLAGVGLTWYTWLEQGRPIAASEQVLSAIARALLLTPDERDHLYALAGVTIPEREGVSCVHAAHLDLLQKLMPYPAAVQSARFDILAYNGTYRFLLGDLDEIPEAQRNCARLLFTDPRWKRAHRDIHHAQQRVVARLRAAYGRHRDEPEWQRFVGHMAESSPDFVALWDSGDVATERMAIKRIRHHDVGDLLLNMTSVWLDDRSGARLVWFAPADSTTGERLAVLARRASPAAALAGEG